jgi:hypothetical protein
MSAALRMRRHSGQGKAAPFMVVGSWEATLVFSERATVQRDLLIGSRVLPRISDILVMQARERTTGQV